MSASPLPLLLFLSLWILNGCCSAIRIPTEQQQQDPSSLVPVGDGLCPNATVSSVCDPNHLLSPDDVQHIEELIQDAHEQSQFQCNNDGSYSARLQLGVYIRLHERPRDKEDVAQMRLQWGIGESTPCGNNGVLLYLTVDGSPRPTAHVYLSPGDATSSTLNRMVLQSVEDGMKPFLRHELYGEAIQAGILDLTARVQPPFADLQEECLRDFYLSSWFFIFVLYCCGGRLLLWVLQFFGRRGQTSFTRLQRTILKQEVEEKLQEIEEHYKHKLANHQGDYMAQCCPICLEVFPVADKLSSQQPNEETRLVWDEKNQLGSDGKALKSLPCGHCFDHSCIVDWMITLRTKNRDARLSCPICMERF